MSKPLACLALALAALACGSPSYTVVDASYGQLGASAAMPEPTGPADLVDTLAAARAAWADAGVTEQAYVPSIEYVPDAEMARACGYPPETRLLGCAATGSGRIRIAQRMATRNDLYEVVAHELGHVLRGTSGHLPCEGKPDALMCRSGYGSDELTAKDVAFVLGEQGAL